MRTGRGAFGPLIDAERLRRGLGAPDLVIVDCRFTLGEPSAGKRGFAEGHIPGAAFLEVDRDLAAAPGARGRHPLPDPRAFEAAARTAGIRADSRVVAYDEAGEGGAARLWWLLRHFGHEAVAVLNGGLGAWLDAGGELETGGARPRRAGDFRARPRGGDTAEADELEGTRLLDARAPERYRGDVEPIDPIAGHIPGALNVPFTEVAPGGRFAPSDELRAQLGDDPFVAYCGSGVTACTLVLAAELAGVGPARLYPGSWSEWSREGRPTDRVSPPPAS
ncbi:MAG TPA: sulfurtransferase [Thermoleophilaceae bacterium]|nr:sulfurtransferase [Thermoleophilaceae bacterium]